MIRSTVFAGMFLAAAAPQMARADGLIFQLPKDGTRATFDMEITQTIKGRVSTIKGTLSISSVGRKLIDDEKCRWIECKMAFKVGEFDQVVISKALIPEKYLGKGESPLDHVIRNWYQAGKEQPVDSKEMAGRGVAVPFLAGPSKDGKDVDAVEVECKLGKLVCSGATGSVETEINKTPVPLQFETRLNEKAPFGVVTSVWKYEIKKDGQIEATGTTKLTLAEVDSTAVSELPDKS
jgi:hypothetical protein